MSFLEVISVPAIANSIIIIPEQIGELRKKIHLVNWARKGCVLQMGVSPKAVSRNSRLPVHAVKGRNTSRCPQILIFCCYFYRSTGEFLFQWVSFLIRSPGVLATPFSKDLPMQHSSPCQLRNLQRSLLPKTRTESSRCNANKCNHDHSTDWLITHSVPRDLRSKF